MNNSLIGIMIGLGVSSLILYSRKAKWANPKLIWLLCFGLFLIGVFGLFISNSQSRDNQVLFFGLCVPLIYWVFDRLFKRLSEKINNRDFILYLRFSNELNTSNTNIKILDKVLSVGILAIIYAVIIIGVLTI